MIDLRLGDCLEVMKTIPDGSIDAIITDPPYGTTACKWDSVIDFELMWEQLNRIIKPNGAIVLFGSEPFSSALRMSNINNYKYDWIWEKVLKTGHLNAKRQPLNNIELIHIFNKHNYYPIMIEGKKNAQSKKELIGERKAGVNTYGVSSIVRTRDDGRKYPSRIITLKKIHSKYTIHPTQKPILLMEYLIKTYTNENETVLDFTMGSGSTMVACKNTNRNGIGIEQDETYFKIAQERINSTLF